MTPSDDPTKVDVTIDPNEGCDPTQLDGPDCFAPVGPPPRPWGSLNLGEKIMVVLISFSAVGGFVYFALIYKRC